MRTNKFMTTIMIVMLLSSCIKGRITHQSRNVSDESHDNITDSFPSYDEYLGQDIRNFFAIDGDSIYMIYGMGMNMIYHNEYNTYRDEYATISEFKKDFCKKHLDAFKEQADGASVNRIIMNLFPKLSEEEFFDRFCCTKGQDTFLIKNDITVIYCLNQYRYNCTDMIDSLGRIIVTKTDNLDALLDMRETHSSCVK